MSINKLVIIENKRHLQGGETVAGGRKRHLFRSKLQGTRLIDTLIGEQGANYAANPINPTYRRTQTAGHGRPVRTWTRRTTGGKCGQFN